MLPEETTKTAEIQKAEWLLFCLLSKYKTVVLDARIIVTLAMLSLTMTKGDDVRKLSLVSVISGSSSLR